MHTCKSIGIYIKTHGYRDGSLGLVGGTATKLTATLTLNFCCGEFGSQLSTEQRRCHVEFSNLLILHIIIYLFNYVDMQ